ncbi:MAG: hypothetical protein J2P36_37415, partial [Ktedonobacteraceae bacterium]|nr:hypothetical protein [Ktedonobacteraceae bacterium]
FGETDRAVIEANSDNALARWTAEQLGPTGVAYLETLAFSQSIAPPQQNASPADELLIVHATPTNVADFLILQPNPLDSRCATPTPEAQARSMLGETRSRLILHGHLHYVSSGFIGTQQVISIGAVGFPFDGDPRAAYALATWDDGCWNITYHRVPYDYEGVITAVTRSGQPQAETIAHRLRTAQWCPPRS